MEYSEIPSENREFRCSHCSGRITIPRNLPATTGPCPLCGGIITSPAPETPAPQTIRQPEPLPAPAIPAMPGKVSSPTVPEMKQAPEPEPPARKPTVIPQPKNPPVVKPPKDERAAPVKAEKKSTLIPVTFALILICGCVGVGLYFVAKERNRHIAQPVVPNIGADPQVKEANYIRSGWRTEAYQVLRDYMAATTSRGKLPYVLDSDVLAPRIDEFYLGSVINDSDTPADAFAIHELPEQDRKRGLFMLIYDQPPQFDMREFFRPLASLEVQYGIDEADLLLSTLARVGNFAMEPLRVHAFFKRTDQGLKLDWEMFAQTKYRTFQNFTELPEAEHTGIFRVFIVEDVPSKNRQEKGTRTYRMADPANTVDTARVNVKVDSDIGKTLSVINWRGSKDSKPNVRTATVELKWVGDKSTPELVINRFICWEFLGLGGREGPVTASNH